MPLSELEEEVKYFNKQMKCREQIIVTFDENTSEERRSMLQWELEGYMADYAAASEVLKERKKMAK